MRTDPRRFYLFDHEFTTKRNVERPMRFLQNLGKRIWKERGGGRPEPVVVAAHGWRNGKTLTTNFDPRSNRIEFARHQRSEVVLIHEMAHALLGGRERVVHGPAFLRTYIELLARYAGYDAEELRFHARNVGLRP